MLHISSHSVSMSVYKILRIMGEVLVWSSFSPHIKQDGSVQILNVSNHIVFLQGCNYTSMC
jgi:hypothetical protein